MHVRVRVTGKPETIVVVESKLTKIEKFRKLIQKKLDVNPKLQRLLYGGKLLEDGYTFHDYNIKLNDVIQVMIRSQQLLETPSASVENKQNSSKPDDQHLIYTDTESCFYVVGDLVDIRCRESGSWFEGKIVRIVHDPAYIQYTSTSVLTNDSSDLENKPPSPSTSPKQDDCKILKQKGIVDYFSKSSLILKKPVNVKQNDPKCGILYKVQYDPNDSDEVYCKFEEIRPRARKEIAVKDLQVGQKVMLNYNTESHHEKGYWYDFKIAEIQTMRTTSVLVGTLYLGPDAIPQDDTKVNILDKVFAIEEVIPISSRSEDYKKLMVTPTEKRSSPLNCLTCRDDEDKQCVDCGCFLCAGKEMPEKIILCDECNHGYHMQCLSPPLLGLPEEDWYCPSCKRDTNTIVAPGKSKQIKKTNNKTNRDWGRGMACVGKTKTCAMPANHFGPIPGIEVGMCWRFRIQLSESGVHRPPVSGIHGRDVEGAYSIVLSGGYEDDYDKGYEFTYTGSGGRDLSGNKRTAEQSCDQTLTRENRALARNCAVKQISEDGGDAGENWREGKPVRVVRSYKMLKHFPQFAPKEGIRYDGIYKVVKYYTEKGKSGFRVWKYLLRRDDPNPAPWEDGAKQYPIVYPDGYLEAEAEKKVLKEKNGVKSGKKRKYRNEYKSESDDELSSHQMKKKKRGSLSANKSVTDIQKVKKEPSHQKSVLLNSNTNLVYGLDIILTKEELHSIKADELNSKLWDECLEICKTAGKKGLVEQVAEAFLCIICQDVVALPVTTPCLHNFCMSCIKLAFKLTDDQKCPCCRGDLSKWDPVYNEQLKSALQTIMPGYDAGKK